MGYEAAKSFEGRVEIVDLRTLVPLDVDLIHSSVKKHNRCLVVTEEPVNNGFAQALSGRIQSECFQYLDAPVRTIGAEEMPAIPLNSTLEFTMLPNADKVAQAIDALIKY